LDQKLVNKLREHGHEAVAAAPNTGVNTLTGEGLAEALKGGLGSRGRIKLSLLEDAAVLNFFETSTRNLLKLKRTQASAPRGIVSRGGPSGFPKAVTSGPRSLRKR